MQSNENGFHPRVFLFTDKKNNGTQKIVVIQLDPVIPMQTPKGHGYAYFVDDPGLDYDLVWTVFLDNGEIWCFRNREVRAVENYTHGRRDLRKLQREEGSKVSSISPFKR